MIEAAACAAASACAGLSSCAAALLFVVFDSEGDSTVAVTAALSASVLTIAGSDCAAAMTKEGSAHIE
ncbi:MAG TPA: hypothetical protein VFP38_10355 [Bradyrhizobium sp.]|nr:hypothetical protein [Bradyrhizobium sp.]